MAWPTGRCGLVLLPLLCLVQRSAQLRTGVAPTYIPTMRQISSYETNNIDTLNDAIATLRSLEAEEYNLEAQKKLVFDDWKDELSHNADLRAENAVLRSDLTITKNTKVYNDDQAFREIHRNQGLEPQNVKLSVTKTTQDDFIWQTNRTNGALTAHAAETLARNLVLDAEKQSVWLSLESNERDEWYFHENSIAVEWQNPHEAIAKEYYEEQTLLHNIHVQDMIQRNADLAAVVPGLTADRDAQESAKQDAEIAKKDFELQAALEELHVVRLQKSKAALEKLIMQFQRANSDLTAYNTQLSSDITTLEAERAALRTSYEYETDLRNAAQIHADHWEVMLNDMRQKHLHARLASSRQNVEMDGWIAQVAVCDTRNQALKADKATLVATNTNLRDTCY